MARATSSMLTTYGGGLLAVRLCMASTISRTSLGGRSEDWRSIVVIYPSPLTP